MLGTFVLNVQYICPQCSVHLSPMFSTIVPNTWDIFFVYLFTQIMQNMRK